MDDFIAVVDLGGQYAHLIARRVRQVGVYSKILKPDLDIASYEKAKGIILSGSPASICDESIKFNQQLYDLGLPILGFCYGHQMFARDLGGTVSKQETKEFGTAKLSITDTNSIFSGLSNEEVVWMSHHDKIENLPLGFKVIASTLDCPTAAIANDQKRFYGLQFHPEVTHTKNGLQMIGNFVFNICKAKKNWSVDEFLDSLLLEARNKAKDKKVFILVSGGVDSMVALTLLNEAIGRENLYALHVDTGFMRLGEIAEVKKALSELGLSDFHIVDASEDFFAELAGIYEPEEKREIIGNLFLKIKDQELAKIGMNAKDWMLAQGTIYPDTIESGGTEHADTIKTHHNRVDLVQKLIAEGKVIEPLEKLYKDEVRELGTRLGLPDNLIWRHPFPGPGLAIRALCSDGKCKNSNDYYSQIEEEVMDVVASYGFGADVRCRVLPIKSVGVQGDLRTYRYPVLISGKLDFESLGNLSTAITNSLSTVNRVIYQVDNKPIKNLALIKADLNRKRLDLLRRVDNIVMTEVFRMRKYREIWQFPTILLPIGENEKESIVLRPIESIEAMTVNFYRMGDDLLNRIVDEIGHNEEISHIFYDITNKPPGTIEWE